MSIRSISSQKTFLLLATGCLCLLLSACGGSETQVDLEKNDSDDAEAVIAENTDTNQENTVTAAEDGEGGQTNDSPGETDEQHDDTNVQPENTLQVTTDLSDLKLDATADFFHRFKDDGYGPAHYVLYIMASTAALQREEYLAKMISSQLSSLVGAMRSKDGTFNPPALEQVAETLDSITDISLVTTISFANDAANSQQPTLQHTVSHVVATVDGTEREFDLTEQNSVMFAPTATRITTVSAPYSISDTANLNIDAHELSVPIADAIIKSLLVDQFGTYDLADILSKMVNCTRGLVRFADILDEDLSEENGSMTEENSQLLNTTIEKFQAICESSLSGLAEKLLVKVEDDMQGFHSGQTVTFKGFATATSDADGKITDLTDGRWTATGVFPFEGELESN